MDLICLFVMQEMVSGVSGLHGLDVLLHVVKGYKLDIECVTILYLQMEESFVKEAPRDLDKVVIAIEVIAWVSNQNYHIFLMTIV